MPMGNTETATAKPGKRGLTFQRERASELWKEIIPLLHEHKNEVEHYPDIELDPDVEAYNRCEELGIIRCYTARLGNELIGYHVNFLKHNMHYRQSLQAVQDALFVAKEHRFGRAGLKLIRYKEERLREEGVQVTYEHLKCNRPETIALFHKLGYEDIDLIVAKRLDK